jgi:hypothetical protein
MASDLRQRDTEAIVLATGVAKSRRGLSGLSQGTIWPPGHLTLAPWSKLSWGLFVPLVFAGNVAVATLAWIIVGLVVR